MPAFQLRVRLSSPSRRDDLPHQVLRALAGTRRTTVSVSRHTTTVCWQEEADTPDEAHAKAQRRFADLPARVFPHVVAPADEAACA